ncbi:AEC family transporter [Companilactobacillus huachuanensis]|uniref:AEC family transporter n=1 Tax=Companilactobacillus huachuanensis TaxID=2559914 RepID=A0ABW1RQF6_9LACO|nr:AEC family transporter [Companilactobacillus huachuanensis]
MHVKMVSGYQSIATIILLILVGFTLKKKGVISDSLQKGLNGFLIKFIIPFSVFSAFLTPFDWGKAKTSLVLIVAGILFYPVMQFLVTKIMYFWIKDDEKKRLFQFNTTYSNAVFMGYPFAQALFGASGLFFASVFNLPFNIYLWSIGFAQFTKQPMNKKGILNTLTNPVIIACIAGYAWWLLQTLVPTSADIVLTPIKNVFTAVGACNTPLSMVVIGGMLADSKIGQVLGDKQVWYFAVMKLLGVPALMLLLLSAVGFKGWTLAIPVVMTAMPTAATGGILAGQYDIHKELAASLITFTTALSALTIPIWLIIILNIVG